MLLLGFKPWFGVGPLAAPVVAPGKAFSLTYSYCAPTLTCPRSPL